MVKKWIVLEKISKKKKKRERRKEILEKILRAREISTKKEAREFLRPVNPEEIKVTDFGIKKKEIEKAIERIKKAVKEKKEIVIYGDYDADGITATAVLWEVLYILGAKATPFIPKREDGYGLNKKGVEKVKKRVKGVSLIITVDNGIVAYEGVDYCCKKGIEVIVTDHHVKGERPPKAKACVHTTKLSGSGVGWVLARELLKEFKKKTRGEKYLDLIAIGSITDLIPLKGVNRSLVKFGLKRLNRTKRVGLLEIIKDAKLELGNISVYEVGYIIGPRLNAMGRLEDAMDSLRVLCTRKIDKAKKLARILGNQNRLRQDLTGKTSQRAIEKGKQLKEKKILVVSGRYNPGIIGLVAGRMVDYFYKPAIVISEDDISKGSARSIQGIDIVKLIRKFSDLLIDCGGHPMAAGFSIEKGKIGEFKKKIEKEAERFEEGLFKRRLKIDMEISFYDIDRLLLSLLRKFAPFGIGNPEPVFVTRKMKVVNKKLVGKELKHLKLQLSVDGLPYSTGMSFYIDTIGFGMGSLGAKIHIGDLVDVVYSISENIWNGKKNLQLILKDIRINSSF